EEPKKTGRRGKTGTWKWLCQLYFASDEFKRLELHTQTVQRQRLEATFEEPTKPRGSVYFGDMPVRLFGKKAVRILRDRKSHVPEGANNRVKAIRRVFNWAKEERRNWIWAIRQKRSSFSVWRRKATTLGPSMMCFNINPLINPAQKRALHWRSAS